MPLGHMFFVTIFFLMTQWRFKKQSYAVLIVVDMVWILWKFPKESFAPYDSEGLDLGSLLWVSLMVHIPSILIVKVAGTSQGKGGVEVIFS